MIEAQNDNRLFSDQIVFIIAIIAKQFYLLPSGSFQISDILVAISFLLCFIVRQRGKIYISANNWLYGVFCFFVIIINLIYSTIYQDGEFAKSSLYFIFNFLVIILFSFYLQEDNNIHFLGLLRCGLYLNLLVQLSVFLLGKGRWMGGGYRYMGTFNDPNQYGVFILFSFLMIFTISKLLGKNWIVAFILSIFLIMPSASSGIMSGVVVFLAGYLIMKYKEIRSNMLIFYLLLLFGVVMLIYGIKNGIIPLPRYIVDSPMYERLFLRTSNMQATSFVRERAWFPLFEHPEEIVFGAGEGMMSRFNSSNEIHSTVLAPLFYYGLLPCAVLLKWIYDNIRGIKYAFWCVYIAVLAESVFLINYRQPLFWMLIVLAIHPFAKKYFDAQYCEENW